MASWDLDGHYEGGELSIQVCCVTEAQGDVVIDPRDWEGAYGCVIPRRILSKFEVTHEGSVWRTSAASAVGWYPRSVLVVTRSPVA